MADSLGLVGVIGTWLAAVLAFIALAGILPGYLLYRQSKTDRYRALNNVHDPHNAYITPGYLLWPGKRFFRTYSVPELQTPPKWTELTSPRDFGVFGQKDARSLTGWLNFTNVLQAHGLKTLPNGKLVFLRQDALLPVHRGWLLLLGIMDRYASADDRGDKGLFVSEKEDVEMDDFGRGAIFGLSGILDHIPPSPTRDDLEPGPESVDKVVFRVHAPEHMIKIPEALSDDGIHIDALITLFLGYLKGVDGKYYTLKMPPLDSWRSRSQNPKRSSVWSHRIWTWDEKERGDLPTSHRRLGQELDLPIPSCIQAMKEITPVDQAAFDQLLTSHSPSTDRKYLFIRRDREGAWIARSSLHLLMLSVLQMTTSRQSALSAIVLQPDNILNYLFDSSGLVAALVKAQKIIEYLPIKQEERQALQNAILELKERTSRKSDRVRWSRTQMDSCVTLDRTLHSVCQKNQLMSRVISILYMQESGFRKLFVKKNPEDADVRGSHFILDPSSKVVRAPATDGGPNRFNDFYFDFTAVFPPCDFAEIWPSPMNAYPVVLSFPEAVVACLKGQLRMVMWELMLPSEPLLDFYYRVTSRVVHIAAQETPLRPRRSPGTLSRTSKLPYLPRVEERSSYSREADYIETPYETDHDHHVEFSGVDESERSYVSPSHSRIERSIPLPSRNTQRHWNQEPSEQQQQQQRSGGRSSKAQDSVLPLSGSRDRSTGSETSLVSEAEDTYILLPTFQTDLSGNRQSVTKNRHTVVVAFPQTH